MPEETIVFGLTKEEVNWFSVPLGIEALQSRVTALRCGLDSTNWRPEGKAGTIAKCCLDKRCPKRKSRPLTPQ